jgi:hypothetical protein
VAIPKAGTVRGTTVTVVGLKELRRDLKAAGADSEWTKGLGQANREIARDVAGWSQSEARSMGGPFAHFAGDIVGRATQIGARVEVRPVANAAFWGAKKTTGWNAGQGRTPNQPRWVGASWQPGGPGGPYAINPTIERHRSQIDDRFLAVIDRFAAFSNGDA